VRANANLPPIEHTAGTITTKPSQWIGAVYERGDTVLEQCAVGNRVLRGMVDASIGINGHRLAE
jgi:hypothetical protein